MTWKVTLAATVLALFAAACGSEAESLDPGDGNSPASGACLVGAPECDDTPGLPTDLPPDQVVGGVTVDGGLTISEALTTGAAGILAVKGFVIVDTDGAARFCELLAESLPPQCGGKMVEIADLNSAELDLREAQGVRWTDELVTLFGQMEGTVLRIAVGVSG